MRNVLFGVALTLAAVTGCTKSQDKAPAAKAEDSFHMMTVDQVEAQLAAKSITAVDCNGDSTRKKMGVVPGAILVTDDEGYASTELPTDKQANLVFYCGNTACTASHQGAKRAIALGYKNVSVMPDGIAGWVKAGKKVQQI